MAAVLRCGVRKRRESGLRQGAVSEMCSWCLRPCLLCCETKYISSGCAMRWGCYCRLIAFRSLILVLWAYPLQEKGTVLGPTQHPAEVLLAEM